MVVVGVVVVINVVTTHSPRQGGSELLFIILRCCNIDAGNVSLVMLSPLIIVIVVTFHFPIFFNVSLCIFPAPTPCMI
jgi:hypothetical protein